MDNASTGLLMVVMFFAGIGWGQWYAEYQVRKQQRDLNSGRISVSMPMNKDDATATMELLTELVRKVKMERESK